MSSYGCLDFCLLAGGGQIIGMKVKIDGEVIALDGGRPNVWNSANNLFLLFSEPLNIDSNSHYLLRALGIE